MLNHAPQRSLCELYAGLARSAVCGCIGLLMLLPASAGAQAGRSNGGQPGGGMNGASPPPRIVERPPMLMSIESHTTVTGSLLPDGTPDPNERQVTRETTIRWLQRARPEFGPRPDTPPRVRMTREERQRLREDIREANKEIYAPGTPRFGPAPSPSSRAFAPAPQPPTQPSSEGR